MSSHITIDKIVKSVLLQKGLTMHWYIEYLKLATDCFRELHFDRMNLTRAVLVAVAQDGSIKYPCDYVDWVALWQKGMEDQKPGYIHIIRDEPREEKLYVDKCDIPACGLALLEYGTDGSDCDAASKVHPYAQATIEAYIIWKSSPDRDNMYSPKGNQYRKQESILAGRLNDLTLEDIDRIQNRRSLLSDKRTDFLTAYSE